MLNVAQTIEEALAFHRQGRFNEAEKLYTRALKAQPRQFDALHLLGMLKYQRGKPGEAYRLIHAALEINPRSADALSNLGMVLHGLKRNDEALVSLEKALALAPGHIDAYNNRGIILLAAGQAEAALECFTRVLTAQPRHIEARINRGNALSELARWSEALAEYDAALMIHPAHPGAHYGRGNALSGLNRYAEAVAAYDRALASSPQHAKALTNRGVALQALNRFQDALASYRQALILNKDLADAHYNESFALLTTGDFRRGFEQYEWRWKRTGMPAERRNFSRPLWLGEYSLQGKTILIHAEQGLGDTIQFARYAKLLARAGANVVFETQPELKTLLAAMDGIASVVTRGETLPTFDVHCPVASLPLAFKTELVTIPADIPYVAAPADRVAAWHSKLGAHDRPRIAIAWSGRPTHANDRNRSIALSRLEPLLATQGVKFISVQRDVRAEDADLLAKDSRITHVGAELKDFADTAAVLSLSDLVICVDTSVAHLAGAMGRPTWIMLPFCSDWRWLLDRDDSPWYPSVSLFRQPAPSDWETVIARVANKVASLQPGA